MPKFSPPPPVQDETWRALVSAADAFAVAAPWSLMYDCDLVGLADPRTGETRIGSVLGNAGEVFAAVFYRRGGVRWIFQMLSGELDPQNLAAAEGIDCLKVEMVGKKELGKEDLARLKAMAAHKPRTKIGWPQIRSVEPGWHPWHVTQTEAEQLLADLPRLTAFGRMIDEHPRIYEGRAETEIPFVPAVLPERGLAPEDLEWRPIVPPPAPMAEAFRPAADQMERLRALPREPVAFEFDSTILPGASFVENGRPCFGRIGVLVETEGGLVLGAEIHSGATPPAEAAGRALLKGLLSADCLPAEIRIGGRQLLTALEPLCQSLGIRLTPASSLTVLDEAMEALTQRFGGGR